MAKDLKKVEVTFEDQQHINMFNKLNTKMHELEAMIRAKKKILEDLEDASNELMLSDEDNIRYVIGECFVHMEKDAAEEKLTGLTDSANGEVKALSSEVDSIKDKMKDLKTKLYSKFGSSINLEE
mmetsp:Transcript_9732/g.24197  ORF Transcript_9732/g.24197 Transcript_9732/m.24197 type:complete len:125 (-) Transcript_9732:329-703(-)|eukprot:CAMPEP_0202865748 /NCGR_PEP_ID=MMETSP1391-20130828/6333_1 /ASSEMBLY_ACC=CAM_ASM_000867 /TAXON_ID=1034604 /ORGANISM="Chlamydomonas leiostraca, Strain SAG 11-49" /LENGTH=124 /DNA_ID=CAMNT_0049545625 /DNA_START=112 /DNA_END=486 /DNA_ORIENTATION=-